MTTEPDPKTVREIARKFLTDPHATPGDVKASIRNHIGSDASAKTFAAWWDAVEADVRKGKVETVATWPNEGPTADQDDEFRLGHGGAWCTACHRAMREGTPVAKVPAVVCKPCAADLAGTGGRLDPSRLDVRNATGAL